MRQVVEPQVSIVSINEFDSRKIYATICKSGITKSILKLFCIRGSWTFCDLSNCHCNPHGNFSDVKSAIRSRGIRTVWEFDSCEEFLAWALNQLSKD